MMGVMAIKNTWGRRLRTMDDLPLDGKRVLMRVDFNVSVGDDGVLDTSEDYRLEAALPAIEELMQKRCRVVLLTHLGRPREDKEQSMRPVLRRLEQLLRESVKMTKTLYGNDVDAIISGLEPGGVVMLPNVRLDMREEQGSKQFAKQLASSVDVFVNEAFSVVHRAHTSVAYLPNELPSCAGRRTVLEVNRLSRLLDNPKRPYVAITSGAKIKTKIGMMHKLLSSVDALCVGGQLANVFLTALGKYKGNVGFDEDDLIAARQLLETGREKLILPVDVVIGGLDGGDAQAVGIDEIPKNATGAGDIGPRSVENILSYCRKASTVMWNGPVGHFEVEAYARATNTLARKLAELSSYRVVGGGDTVNALEKARVVEKYDHVSIGGGAMIAFLEGKRLPGLEPLYVND